MAKSALPPSNKAPFKLNLPKNPGSSAGKAKPHLPSAGKKVKPPKAPGC